jgi:hypothetical protein
MNVCKKEWLSQKQAPQKNKQKPQSGKNQTVAREKN